MKAKKIYKQAASAYTLAIIVGLIALYFVHDHHVSIENMYILFLIIIAVALGIIGSIKYRAYKKYMNIMKKHFGLDEDLNVSAEEIDMMNDLEEKHK